MLSLTPHESAYRDALDPHHTLPWLQLESETQLFDRVYYGGYTAEGTRICDVHLTHNSPFDADAAHVSWICRLDRTNPDRPKGVGLAAHLLLIEQLEGQGETLVSDPYMLSDDGTALWQRMVSAGIARQTNRFFRLPHTLPHFTVVSSNKIRTR